MAIFINTDKPQELLKSIEDGIKNKSIDTWQKDPEGDYTHLPYQWQNKAWLRPHIEENRLVFGIIGRNSEPMPKVVYAVYHGRFSEMILTHFDNQIKDIKISSFLCRGYDFIWTNEAQG